MDAAAGDDRDDRIDRVLADYLAALEAGRPPPRAAFLARYPDLAAELAPLLDSVEVAHHAGRQLAADAGVARVLPAGTRVDRFELVRAVGRGGMGVVYEAADADSGRRVALKLLTADAAADDRLRRRFLHEARTAALLRHPHVVPAVAVGQADGAHFYAMPFVPGRPLDAVLRAVRALTAGPGGEPGAAADPDAVEIAARLLAGFPPTESPDAPAPPSSARYVWAVAGLAVQAADALAHAHDQGVVHRDVKPGNLLLEPTGKLWLTDFGLALARDAPAGQTSAGARPGTLRYMAPEQAAGRRDAVDHRADVYALGATLYELLALRPAFDGTDGADLLRQILHRDPPPVGRLNPGVPAALAAVVRRAMANEPADRYPSARALAADLRRFLAGQPVVARPPGRLKRLRRWAGRHRRGLAAAAGAVLTGVAVGVGVSGYAVLAAYRAAEDRRAAAERRKGLLLSLVERVNRSDLLLKNTPGAREPQRALRLGAREALERLAAEPGAGPRAWAEASRACERVYEVELARGDRDAADAALAAAVRWLGRAADADPGHRLRGAKLRLLRAALHAERGEPDAAVAETRAAVAVLETLAREEPAGRAEYRNPLGDAYRVLAADADRRGDLTGAIALAERGLAIDRGLAGQFPDPKAHPLSYLRLAASLDRLAHYRVRAGDPGAAEHLLREEVRADDALAAAHPDAPSARGYAYLARASLGNLLVARGRHAEARPEFAAAAATAGRFAEGFPEEPFHQAVLVLCDEGAAQAAYLDGRAADAAAAYARLVARVRGPAGPDGAGRAAEQLARVPVPGLVAPEEPAARLAAAPAGYRGGYEYPVVTALARLRAGDNAGAEAGFRAVVAARPAWREGEGLARYYLALSLTGQGQVDAARRAYEEAEAADLLRFAHSGWVRVAREEARRAVGAGGR